MGEKICISDLTLDALTAYIVGLGQPKFRAKQIFKWLHQKLVTEFSQMTDQPKALLAQLEEQCTIAAPVIRRRQQSRTVRSSIFCSWPTATASKPCSCATNTAILSVCPPRWAARWAAGSAPPPRRAACAT